MMEMSFEEVRRFDNDPANICNCKECPHNQGMDDWQNRLPCGQWHCWVETTTRDCDE